MLVRLEACNGAYFPKRIVSREQTRAQSGQFRLSSGPQEKEATLGEVQDTSFNFRSTPVLLFHLTLNITLGYQTGVFFCLEICFFLSNPFLLLKTPQLPKHNQTDPTGRP